MILLTIICAIILIGTITLIIINKIVDNLRDTLQIGDTVRVYIGNESYSGTVLNIEGERVTVNVHIIPSGEIHTFHINDIYL